MTMLMAVMSDVLPACSTSGDARDDDETLVAAAVAGDLGALEALYPVRQPAG